MQAAGTAIATVLSQGGAFVAAFIYMYRRREEFDFELKLSYLKLRKEPLAVIVKLGIPQLVRTTLVHYSMLWVNSNINSYGLVASATNSVGNKIQKFMNIFMHGVDSASSAMIAQNLGARKQERAKKTLLYTLGYCLIFAAFSSILALTIPKTLYGIFTTDRDVIEFGVVYMKIMVMTFFMSATTGSLQTMVTGSGFVSLGFIIGIMDGVVCRIGFSLLFLYVFNYGVVSFFWGTAFSRTIPGLICFIYFVSGKWRTRKLLIETEKKKCA
jgi:Na+-driven multidrug efflux pump